MIDINSATVLISGAAGFIGSFLAKRLLETTGATVIGIDCITNYYDTALKDARLNMLKNYPKWIFIKGDISNKKTIDDLFARYKITIVVNLAAQAGVRYSIDNPAAYINSNIVGFFNILEAARHNKMAHLVFASSSSVYGGNTKTPFSESDNVDRPVSLYAATKKSDELMAYCYCKLYGIKATGLRFFTVYGPMGRPDMAYYKFTNLAREGKSISVYNNGDLYRDFTYIDDIIEGVMRVMQKPPVEDDLGSCYKIYNIGGSRREHLTHFIDVLEAALLKEGVIKEKLRREMLPMQAGDVYQTYADASCLEKDFDFKPTIDIEHGLTEFAKWYKEYYHVKQVCYLYRLLRQPKSKCTRNDEIRAAFDGCLIVYKY